MVFAICPFCSKEEDRKPIKEWNYGAGVKVKRFKCKCEKMFNLYTNPTKIWTIPKKKQ